MIPDYDLALHYILRGHWDNLFTLMLRTKDDMLGKKIHLFLHAYYNAAANEPIVVAHDALLGYIDHAQFQLEMSEVQKV